MAKSQGEYFNEGKVAALNGLPVSANPMLFKSWPHESWRLGHEYGQLSISISSKSFEDTWWQDPPRVDKKPIDQGQAAFKAGRDLEDCPYDPGTVAHSDWRSGWFLAEADEDPYNSPQHRRALKQFALFVALIVAIGSLIILVLLRNG